MSVLLTLIAIGGYLLTTFFLYRQVSERPESPPRPPVVLRSVWFATLMAHLISLGMTLFTPEGLDLNFVHALSLVAWLISALLFIACLREPLKGVAMLVLPFAAGALAAGLVTPALHTRVVTGDPGLQLHVLGSLLAFALLALAAAQALVLSYQDHHLHNHRLTGWIRHLPPLQHMESFLFQLIGLGFVLLSAALLTGWLFIENIFDQHLVHKTVLSFLAWLVFGGLLLGRKIAGWRGRKAIRGTLWGFGLLLVGYFGSKLVLEIILTNRLS